MSVPVTVRLENDSASELRRIASRERRSVSEVGARMIEEALRQNRFPYIEFRSIMGERTACVKGALEVWQLVMVAKEYSMDAERTAAHLDLPMDHVRSALAYYAAFPEEIDSALAENDIGFERLREILPNIERITLAAARTKSDAA